ncbi:MAG: energy transducer TonB [Gemmatimonadaceae bacterium]
MSVRTAHLARVVAFAVAVLSLPTAARAQGTAFEQPQLDVPPKVASPEMTSRLLARSYPAALKRAGVTGTVNVEFVVDATGKVEPSSLKIVDSTSPELAAAAKSVVPEIKFKPGERQGKAVRSIVVLPIVYK